MMALLRNGDIEQSSIDYFPSISTLNPVTKPKQEIGPSGTGNIVEIGYAKYKQ